MTPEQHAAEIRKLEPAMAAAYLADVRAVEGAVSAAEVERLIREDDQNGLVTLLSLGAMTAFTELFRAAFVAGARNEFAGRYRFDSNTWAVVNLLMESISGIQDQAELDLRATVAQVLSNGQSVRNKSLDLLGVISKQTGRRSGGVVGLPGNMAEYVMNARAQLMSGDEAQMRAYLRRSKRDISYDKFVKPGERLTLEQANMISRAYAQNLVNTHAKSLAATYAAQAYNSGRNQSILQQIQNGNISSDQVTKRWKTQRDERVRSSHASMNNQRVGFDAPFTSGLGGLLMYPCDTSMGASEQDVWACRCQVEYVIKRRG